MNAKRNRFPIGTCVILLTHLVLCIVVQMNPLTTIDTEIQFYLGLGVLFAAFLATFAAMASEMRLFTGKSSRISDFAHAFLPCFMQILLIAAGEIIAAILMRHLHLAFWNSEMGLFWAILCAMMLLFSGVVVFVTGAARTVLYHDEKRERQ